MSFLEEQIINAKNNYNYFFMKMILCFLNTIFKLFCMILISFILNYVIINIIVLVYTIYSFAYIVYIYKYYTNITMDIKDTLRCNDLTFEIDFSLINKRIFKGLVKYGK